MQYILHIKIFIALILFSSESFTQGIKSSGAFIISEGAHVHVFNGDFVNITGTQDGKINSDGTITIEGEWMNNASTNVFMNKNTKGTVVFKGGYHQAIQGSNETYFENILVHKAGNVLNLSQNINVFNDLILLTGRIHLQNYNIDLRSSGQLIDETSDNRITVSDVENHTGTITASSTVDNQTINIGNLGFEISTTENLGEVNIARGHKRKSGYNGCSSNKSISRYYDSDLGELSENTTIKMHYFEDELDETEHPNESTLVLFQLVDLGLKALEYTSLDANVNTTDNYIETTGYPYNEYIKNHPSVTFHDNFTLGSEESPLPVELLNFEANCTNQGIIINWATASENFNDFFTLEYSQNLETWEEIHTVDGLLSSNSLVNYEYLYHSNAITNYFRLSQTNLDGITKILDITEVNCHTIITGTQVNSIIIKPSLIKVNLQSDRSATIQLYMVDVLGKIAFSKSYNITPGYNTIEVNSCNFRKGVYFVLIENANTPFSEKIVVY